MKSCAHCSSPRHCAAQRKCLGAAAAVAKRPAQIEDRPDPLAMDRSLRSLAAGVERLKETVEGRIDELGGRVDVVERKVNRLVKGAAP